MNYFHYTIITLFLLFYTACSSEIKEDRSKQKKNSNPEKKVAKITANLQEEGVLRPFSFSLVGTLGGKHPIEMFLAYKPEDLKKGDPCVEVLGDYLYVNEDISSFKLEGELCFDMGIVTLHSKRGKQTIKSFKGKFDGQVHEISGKWAHNEAEEHHVFELKNTSETIEKETLYQFAKLLDKHLGSSKKCSIDKVGFDEKGIFIKNLKGKNLAVTYFSPNHFRWNTSAKSENKSSGYNEIVDLWFYNKDKDFVIVTSSSDWQEKKDSNGSLEEQEIYKTEVWKYNGNQFENIFVKDVTNTDLSKRVWYAMLTKETVQLHENTTGGLWEWNH
jgi:hypothetical protein